MSARSGRARGRFRGGRGWRRCWLLLLAHEYFGVDRDLVLEVVRHKIPELRRAVEAILAQEGS